MENLRPWNELLYTAGKSVEDVSKTLKSKRTLSIYEVQELSNSLKNVADVLDQRIDSLKEGN